VTLKKFTSNAAKKCIVVEYILGSDGAKKDAVQAVCVCLRVCVFSRYAFFFSLIFSRYAFFFLANAPPKLLFSK
jgi:hypothetical protein